MEKILFLDPAVKEFELAIEYYNRQSEGLGFEFALEVKRTLERIARYPLAWHPLSTNSRRCRIIRFPYAVVYSMREKKIIVIAIMHLHQKPRSWSL